MTDRIDEEGRASFVQTLPRKVTELRATLGTLVADPKSQRMRDELRRRLHALYTLTRSYKLDTLSEGLREGIAHLDAIRGASVLSQRDLETLADLIATLPALAQRDLPDQPSLFQSRAKLAVAAAEEARAAGAAAASEAPAEGPAPGPHGPIIKRASLPPLPQVKSQRGTVVGMQPAQAPNATQPRPASLPPPATPGNVSVVEASPPVPTSPLGVLVVGGEGVAVQVRRALPPEAEITVVRALSDAITAARDTSPDVIVAEVAAPADGLGLIAALRGDPLTDFLPVVLLATMSDAIDAETARAQGAVDLVTMPVESEGLRGAIERAAQGVTGGFAPSQSFGDVTLEELTQALQEEIRRGILGAAGPRAGNARISLGQGSEVLAATWEAIVRVRDVVEKRTRGKVRFELPGTHQGFAGAHVLSIGAEDEGAPDDDGSLDDPLPGRRALVVDDDPGVVWFFAGLLREAGMEVTECTDSSQALREARRVQPDVVISDILMPGMDGFALCRAIRRDVALRNVPVILLSWKEDLLVRMRELGANAQGFLRKESKGEAILARVRAVARPRIRLLGRLEQLAEGTELRGRVERVGVFSLVAVSARSLVDATLTVTDSFSVTEIELRGGQIVAVVRTLQDGSLVRGERALLQVLGASNARFSVRRANHAVRANVQAPLSELLEGGAALISAVEDSLSGAALLEVASVDLDSEAAVAYARSLPEAMRGIVERLVIGESPRNLVLRDGIAPQELEPILVELARRGAIRTVRGQEGQDLVAPRYAAAMRPAETAGAQPKKDSGTMPAVLRVPDGNEAMAPAPVTPVAEAQPVVAKEGASGAKVPEAAEPVVAPTPAKTPSWRPPLSADEAAKPGFGLEGSSDSLANAVLDEISAAPPAAEDSDEGPEFTEGEDETALSEEEIARAARSTGTPLDGVKLDARGLPRRSNSVDDLPAIEGDAFTPHEPAKKDDRPSDSVIIDIKALGAQVEVREAPPSTKKKPSSERAAAKTDGGKRAEGSPASERKPEAPSTMNWAWIVVGMLVLGLGSFLLVRLLSGTAPQPAVEADAGAETTLETPAIDAATATTPGPMLPDATAALPTDAGSIETNAAATDAGSASALVAPTGGGADGGLVYEDPAPFLDGGVLAGGRGLLVIDGPRDPDGEITVNQRPVGLAPVSLALSPGVHTIRYRTHAVVVFRFVPVQSGRAVRITLPREP